MSKGYLAILRNCIVRIIKSNNQNYHQMKETDCKNKLKS